MLEIKNETINQRIKRYRKACNLTQHQVAELLCMKDSTYSQAEREGNITCELLIKLSTILGIDPRIILFGEEKQHTHYTQSSAYNCFLDFYNFKERTLIKIYRNLSKEAKCKLYEFLSEIS